MPPYLSRFDTLIAELRACPALDVKTARIGPPTPPAVLAAAQKIAGPSWPDGMTALYTELSSVDVEYWGRGVDVHGAIHIPPVTQVWDYAALEDELWFDFLEPDHPYHRIRPIDRFEAEAYAVLYLGDGLYPAEVFYHYCGESLIETGLSYRTWLEALFRSRGVAYWLSLFTGPRRGRTWVDEGHEAFQKLFPDFQPASMVPKRPRRALG